MKGIAVGAVVCAVLPAGCSFDTSGLSTPARPRFECIVDIDEYGIGNPPVDFPVTKSEGDPSAWDWRRFELVTPSPPLTLYLDDGHVPTSVPNAVAGSYLLQLERDDRLFQPSSGFLRIPVSGTDFQRLWVAFDTRAVTPPSWLSARFDKKQASVYSTSCPDAVGLPPGSCETRYLLWAPKNLADFLTEIELGANNAPGVRWKDDLVGEQYLLLLRNKPSITPIKLRTLDSLEVAFEATDLGSIGTEQILSEAGDELDAWLALEGNGGYKAAVDDGRVQLVADPAQCRAICWMVDGQMQCVRGSLDDGGGRVGEAVAVNAWPRSSVGEVDPNLSSASVRIVETGSTASTELAGQVKFRITEPGDAELGAVDLVGGDVSVDDIPVTDISVGHDLAFLAACTDAIPAGGYRLCGDYSIPTGQFVASGVSELDGDTLPLRLLSARPMPLEIDFNARTFHLAGGPLRSVFQIDGEDTTLELEIDITGNFVNFAPIASAEETPKIWECGDNSQAVVSLYGSASYDEDGHGDIASYLWVEDLGALSQTVLGTTSAVVRSMSFGAHEISLVVTDGAGISSTRSFTLDVVDSQIDSVSFPPDQWVQDPDGGGVPVDIGTAFGSDDCSGVVATRSDAPADLVFPPGYTPVTWVADDLRGNVEIHTQGVYVVAPIYFPPPIVRLSRNLALVGRGDSLQVTLSTQAQGEPLVLDEYVLLETAAGAIFSLVDEHWVEGVVPRIAGGVFRRAADEELLIYEGVLSEDFPGHGGYRFSARLVPEGASPLENAELLGVGLADVYLDTAIFADGFESGDAFAWTDRVP